MGGRSLELNLNGGTNRELRIIDDNPLQSEVPGYHPTTQTPTRVPLEPKAQEAAAIDARHGTYLLKDPAELDGYTMGRRSQKPPSTAGRGTQDIGDMLQRPMAPKMATPAERTPASPDEGEQHGAGLEISTAPQATESLAGQDTQTLATKQDIADLLMEMRRMHAADINLIKTEMQAMTARTRATEEDILDLQREVREIKDTCYHMQAAQSTLITRLDQTEDRNRRANLKLRGIPDTIDSSELPHYLRRLIATLLPPAQAKNLYWTAVLESEKPDKHQRTPLKMSLSDVTP
ncbi:Hypothetical predicted protein [Pelobates cultripes]|uniref:Uncharacterized protein n=1 Tax=Pelobates cultripes TaxID=61616 RepID=A0AAD1TA94_PELCU|nr:Hypothetical predicted protein [Pelobates cultripes]